MNYGGFWIRLIAYVVDCVIVTIAVVAISLGAGLAGADLAGAVASFLVSFLYWPLMQCSARQATFGKSLMGLKVTGLDGGRISFPRSLAREIAKIVSALPLMIGFLLAAFTGRKQALHDFVASTTVVRAEPGHVVAGLAIAVLALFAPALVVMFFGAGLVAGLMGGMAGMMITEGGPAMKMEPPKPQPVPAKPAAVPPKPEVVPPKPAVAAPPPAAPSAVAQAAPPKPKPAVKEPPKPTAQEAPRPAPEPAARAEEAPKPPAPPPVAEAPAPRFAGPVTPGPKFNDLVTAVLYRDADAVNQLLASGKWPDKADSRGMTPLMIAVDLGDEAIAEALLKAGADPGRAMSIARAKKNAALISLLERYSRPTSQRP